jgi:chromosome partitioning protein
VSRIVSIHSYLAGVGKTTLAVNLAAMLAAKNQTVCIIDANFSAPKAHDLLRLDPDSMPYSLCDFLLSDENIMQIGQACYDVTAQCAKPGTSVPGTVYLLSTVNSRLRAKLQTEGYDTARLREGLDALAEMYNISLFIIDCGPGINPLTLPMLALADLLLALMELSQEHYHGTSVLVEVANKIEIPLVLIAANKIAQEGFNFNNVRAEIQRVYSKQVGALVPSVSIKSRITDTGLIAIDYPNSPFTTALGGLVAVLLSL